MSEFSESFHLYTQKRELAEKLGLTYYEWLSADNIEDQLDDEDISNCRLK